MCGKSYEACRTPNPNGVFRWREVACSYECAQQYIAQRDHENENKEN